MKNYLKLLLAGITAIILCLVFVNAPAQTMWYASSPEELQEIVSMSERISIPDVEYSSDARVRMPVVFPAKFKCGYINIWMRGVQNCDTTFLYRMPPDQNAADNIYNSQPVRVYNPHGVGIGKGSYAEMGATLKFTMRDGLVKNFNDGIKLWFCLEGHLDNMRFVNNKRSGVSVNGGGNWTNANGVMGTSNASSNCLKGVNVTIIPSGGALCGLEVINSITSWDGLTIQLAASTGRSKYGIIYNHTFNNQAATNNKEITFDDLYFEMDCDSALILANTREGVFNIPNCTVVRGNQTFINATSVGNTRFNIGLSRGSNVKMKGDKNGFWRFTPFPGNTNYTKPEYWIGTKPSNVQVIP